MTPRRTLEDLLALLFPVEPPRLDDGRWRDALALADATYVTASLARLASDAPSIVAERALEAREQVTARNGVVLSDVRALDAALARANVHAVLLKGAALLLDHPTARHERHTSDIDLLVRATDLDRLCEALAAAEGWRALRRVLRDGSSADGRHLSAACLRAAQPSWVGPHGTGIDVHLATPFLPWPPSRPGVAELRALAVPSTSALLRHLSHHVGVHHRWDVRFALRHLLDTAWIYAGDPRVSGLTGVSRRSLEMVRDLSDPTRADGAREAVARQLAPSIVGRAARGASQRVRRALLLLGETGGSPARLRWLVAPHARYVRSREGARGADTSLVAYHRSRILRMITPWTPIDGPPPRGG